jgi:hypothetical protein
MANLKQRFYFRRLSLNALGALHPPGTFMPFKTQEYILYFTENRTTKPLVSKPFYGKGPHRLLWAGSRAASRQTAIYVCYTCLNHCVIFIVRA